MRSSIEALPTISFDLGGVATQNESFATGGTIFSQGDIAETRGLSANSFRWRLESLETPQPTGE
jgi:hypothetical protein